MPLFVTRSSLLLALFTALPGVAGAQASPFLPVNDPVSPLIEHLIIRGDLHDPSPLSRPFRRGELATAFAATPRAGSPLQRSLRGAASGTWWRVTARGGITGVSQGRRDLLQAGGPGAVTGLAEATGEVGAGPFIAVLRGAADNRPRHDLDWPDPSGVAGKDVVVRVVEAYVAAEWRWGAFQAGQIARQWGPEGVPGVAVSDAAYPHPSLGLEIGRGALRFSGVATRLHDGNDAAGHPIERYYALHRLSLRAAPRLWISAWEAAVIAGPARSLDGITRAIVPLLVVPTLVTSKSERNEMVGVGLSWRPGKRSRVEAELAIDDWNFDANNPYPQRWAVTVTGAGALGATASWAIRYTTVSSLAFRTLDRQENFSDRGVGLGRLFPDNEVLSVTIGVPLRTQWLMAPRLAVLRQGEGRIEAAFPSFVEASGVPARFIGTVATTLWAGAGISGREGPFALAGEAGLRHTRNPGQVAGRRRTSAEARVSASLEISFQGTAR